jgi:hypothetical protein
LISSWTRLSLGFLRSPPVGEISLESWALILLWARAFEIVVDEDSGDFQVLGVDLGLDLCVGSGLVQGLDLGSVSNFDPGLDLASDPVLDLVSNKKLGLNSWMLGSSSGLASNLKLSSALPSNPEAGVESLAVIPAFPLIPATGVDSGALVDASFEDLGKNLV